MHSSTISVIYFLDLFLFLIQKGFFFLLDIISTLKEKSCILDSQILALINLNRLIPFSHSPLLLL